MNSKTVLAGLALAGALAAAAAPAQARSDVQWSVTIGSPLPALVVRDAYYPRPPVVVVPRHVGYGYGDRDRDGIPNRYDRSYNPRWDRDGDGVPNRYDRYPGGRHGYGDRDRDGVPNRYDRHDRNPYRY